MQITDLCLKLLQEVQNKATLLADIEENDVNKILSTPVSSNRPLHTSTPSRALSVKKKKANWKSLSPAEQLEILHDVANEHTKVSLDFEGLRHSIIAAQKVSALQVNFFIPTFLLCLG